MTERLKETFKDLKLTKDEMNRLSEAMKKEEFRKLLVEYAEEISDPKNRQLYEEEITKLEQERGSDVTFIHPEPGYCIKTTQNGAVKCFINISKNTNIDKPTSQRGGGSISQQSAGLTWSIPHTCSKPRPDVDRTGQNECVVYDVVFHPDAYRMGETNKRFDQLLKDSAYETIEKSFGVKLDRANAKVLKNMNFKGRPTASVIRTKKNGDSNQSSEEAKAKQQQPVSDGGDLAADSDDAVGDMIEKLKQDYLATQINGGGDSKSKAAPSASAKKLVEEIAVNSENNTTNKYTVPNHRIVHRGSADMQDFSHQIDHTIVGTTRPKELAISIDLPLCKSSGELIVDIFERRLYLESNEPNYKLDLSLPYPVNEKEAKAKFDKSKRCLNVTLPVVPFVAKVDMMSERVVSLSDENNNTSNHVESGLIK
jgi:dynein assembly factor 2